MGDDSTVSNAGTVVRGAFTYGAGRVASNFFGFFINLLLTNALGAAGYGVYVYGRRIVSISSVFSQLGSGNALLRFIPKQEGDDQKQNQTLGLVVVTSSIASVLLSGALFVAAPEINSLTLDDPLFTRVMRVLAILLPFKTLSDVVMSVFRSLELLEYRVLIGNFVNPVVRIIAVGVALLVGASTVGVIAALVVTGGLVTVVAFGLLISRTSFRPMLGSSRAEIREYFNYSLPLTASRAGSIMYNQADILMVGIFLSPAAVGVYGIAIMVAGFLTLPLTAVNQLFPPVASDLYERGERGELRDLYRTATRWSLTVSAFLALSILVYRRQILRMFGEEFVAGAVVISLYAVGKSTNAIVGPSGFVLMMTDHQYVTTINAWVTGVLNVVLNYVLILQFGIIGAALATAATEAAINLARLVQVWYLEDMHPYSPEFLKPFLASGLAFGVMYAVRQAIGGWKAMFFGGAVGGVTFLLALVVLGLEPADKQLLQRAWARLPTSLVDEERVVE